MAKEHIRKQWTNDFDRVKEQKPSTSKAILDAKYIQECKRLGMNNKEIAAKMKKENSVDR